MRKAPGVMQMRQTRQMQIDGDACTRTGRLQAASWADVEDKAFLITFEGREKDRRCRPKNILSS